MTTQIIDFDKTPGLIKEMLHLEGEAPAHYTSLEQLQGATQNSLYATSVAALDAQLPRGSTVLDVGCGFGETSLLLASLGHTVHSLEPARSRCETLQRSAEALGVSVQTYMCIGEAIGQVGLPKMDGALFHASLHHCDAPVEALMQVRGALKGGGVVVLNEPTLRAYRSKKRFYRLLEEDPVKMGHYGGNEHIYYFKEYVAMLRQVGFARVEASWVHREIDPRVTLVGDLGRRSLGMYQQGVLRCLLKYGVHQCVARLPTWGAHPLLRWGLLQSIFTARASS